MKSKKEVEPVINELFEEECGSCHFAYQPGLLPEASWHKLLTAEALADHFNENAELDEDVRKQLLDYAITHSADKTRRKRSRKIMSSLGENDAPLRITKVPYIEQKHKQVYEDYVTKNDKVKSLSYCNKCHQKAKLGIYDDDTVYMPGYGYNSW